MAVSGFSELLHQIAALPASGSASVVMPGDRLGRFEIVRELGRGGFGVVHEARDTDLGRHVAIKMLRLSEHYRARFDDEATTAARLNHPNIVTLHDHGVHDGMPYLVLELLRGHTLRQRLADGPLPESQVRDLGIQLARALVHAHAAGVIHRDLKPENVFLRDDGLIKLLDFGVSWARPSDAAGSSGTRGYMAPEQARGEAHDGRADVYALGVVLYEAATGKHPGEPMDLASVPAELVPAIERALARGPEARPAAPELLAMLSERGGGESARPYRWLEAFREDDARWFYGRDREIARLRLLLDSRPVVVLAGASGAGKSSLVRAGLLPRLVEEHWRVVTLRARHDSAGELIGRLASIDGWREHPGRVGDRLRADLRGGRMLIFVDQAEQLVRWPPGDREAFLGALLAAADDADGPIRLVLAVRDDFLIELARSTALRDELGRSLMLLGPPDAEELTASLVEPARGLDVTFEPGLAEDVVGALLATETAVADPAPLPLLQLAASRLWEERDREKRTIPRAALARLGGMAGLLAHHADEVLNGLSPERRALARTILLSLVTSERIRRSVERERLVGPAGAENVLDHLIEGRLVVGGETIELAHESLITGWATLSSWLEDDASRRLLRDRIAAASLHWVERGRPRELLWRGTALADAVAMLDELSGRDRAFVVAGRAQARRRRQAVLGSVAVATALAVIASVAAVRSAGAATRERSAARVQAILHRAELADDPAVAALLLGELDDADPPGARATALRIGARPVPFAILRHSMPILAAEISHDGKLVATCAGDGCRLWSSDGRGRPRVLPAGRYIRFNHDDTALFIVGYVGEGTEVRRVALDGTTTRALRHPRLGGWTPLVLPDDRFVMGTQGGEVIVWDGQRQTVIAHHDGRVTSLVALPDGRILSGGGHQAIVTGDGLPPIVLRHDEELWGARVLADGRILTIAGNTLRLWPAAGGTPTVLATDVQSRLLVADGGQPADAGGRRIAFVNTEFRVVLASLTGEQPFVLDRRHHGVINQIAVVAGGVATAGDDGQVMIASGGATIALRGHVGPVNTLAVSRDGRTLVSGGADGTARVWRSLDEAPAMKFVPAGDDFAWDVRFSPDGTRLLVTSNDKPSRILDVAGATVLYTLPKGDAQCGAWLRDGGVLLSDTNALRIYDADRLRTTLSIPQKPGPLQDGVCGDISPDGRLAAAATTHGVYLFDVATGVARETGLAEPRISFYHRVSFSPDGRWLLGVATWDQVYLWPVDGSAPPVELHANRDPIKQRLSVAVNSVSFFPDGKRIVTADWGGDIRFWSRDGREDTALASTGGEVARPTRDGRHIAVAGTYPAIQSVGSDHERLLLETGDPLRTTSIDVSPDGRRAATCDNAGNVRLWWIAWADLVARMRASTTACLTVDQRVDLLEESPPTARERFTACERHHDR